MTPANSTVAALDGTHASSDKAITAQEMIGLPNPEAVDERQLSKASTEVERVGG